MSETDGNRPLARRPGVVDRAHTRPARRRQVLFRYTDDEYATVRAAAERAGYTTSGYIAEVALAAAGRRDEVRPASGWDRETLITLNLARDQVARIGVNLNQAVAQLNATGESPIWLDRAVAIAARAVIRLEDAAADVSAGLAPRRRRRLRRAI